MKRRYSNRLTQKEIVNVKAKDNKTISLYDGGGLQLNVKPNGSKLWEILYVSSLTKKRRRSGIGKYPEVTLKMAREILNEHKKLIASNIDPIEYKRGQIGINGYSSSKNRHRYFFNDIIDDWLTLKKRDLSPRTYKKRVQQFDKFIKPYFKDMMIKDITHPLIVAVLEKKAQSSLETAYRMKNYINEIYQYAITKGYCEINIVANINIKTILPKMKTKHHPKITDISILKELIQKIENYQGNRSVKNALRLVLHLPLRASNLVNLKWSYIDFEKRMLTIPRGEMKVKDENLDDFKLYLTDEVIKILNEQKKISQNQTFVFTTHPYSDKAINAESPNRALRLMGFTDIKNNRKITLHGFRGTFRSLADTYQLEHNATFEVKESVLDHHVGSKVVKSYSHKACYFEQSKILLEWWSGFLVRL